MGSPKSAVIAQHREKVAGRVIGLVLCPDGHIPHGPVECSTYLRGRHRIRVGDTAHVRNTRGLNERL